MPARSGKTKLEQLLQVYEHDKENADKRLREADSTYSRLLKPSSEADDLFKVDYSGVQAELSKLCRNQVFAKRLRAKGSLY